MAFPLLSTKLSIPPARARSLPRSRLTDKLLNGLEAPGSFALVSGPAGFGKTTLLADFAARTTSIAWLSLDAADNEPARFWSYLIAAIQTVQPGLGETALALLHAPQPLPPEAVLTLLINDLAHLESGLALILDDFHLIQNPSIHAAFAFLLEHLPENLYLVLATRIDPPFPLARFRARGQLVEVRANDLRFSPQEAGPFLRQVMGLELTAGEVQALAGRTEGWAAGLQLAGLALQAHLSRMQTNTAGDFLQAFTGSQVYIAEYLFQEVFQAQPEDMQAFLLKTSILERLNAGLCEAILANGENGQAALAALRRSNLFVDALDEAGQWFRYHPLFADLLQSCLQERYPAEVIATLHQRAADWYERQGLLPEAVLHARAAKDEARLVRLVEDKALPLILQAHVRTVESWLEAIPKESFERSPRLMMASAWLHLLRGELDQAEPYFDRLNRMLTGDRLEGDLALQAEWLALKSERLGMLGRAAESRDEANRGLEILPEGHPAVRSLLLTNLASACQQMLDYEHAAETFRRIAWDARLQGDLTGEILGVSVQGQMLIKQGKLHAAFETVSECIGRMETRQGMIPFAATLYGELGQIYYDWRQLDLARGYLQRAAQISGQTGYSDSEIYLHVIFSKMHQMEGNWDAAAQEMRTASEIASRTPPAVIREEILAQQVRVYLGTGQYAAAQALLQAEGFPLTGEIPFPTPDQEQGKRNAWGKLANTALRVLLARAGQEQDLLAQAADLAGQVLEQEMSRGHLPVALETLLVRSQIHAALGDQEAELAGVKQAAELARPHGFISLFVEEGPGIQRSLSRLQKRIPSSSPLGSYVRSLLEAFPEALPSPSARPLVEPLTPRELEVLQLVAAGDSNKTIAEKLVITVSAVKKHTANIYGKLGVTSRTQAIACARQLRLLPPEV